MNGEHFDPIFWSCENKDLLRRRYRLSRQSFHRQFAELLDNKRVKRNRTQTLLLTREGLKNSHVSGQIGKLALSVDVEGLTENQTFQ